jgi:hypothetical protein
MKTDASNLTITKYIAYTAQNYRVPYNMFHLTQHNLKIHSTTIFESSIKENDDSNKTCRYADDLSPHKLNLS